MYLVSLLPLTALLVSTTSAAPLTPRQLTSATLSLSWSEPNHDSVFISNKNYNCGPYTLVAYGGFDPFTIDVVAGQTILSTLGNGFGAGNISWQPDVPLGTTFALRLTDSRNSTASSTPVMLREIKGKDKWGCEMTKEYARSESHRRYARIALESCAFPMVIAGVFLICVLCGYREKMKRKRTARAAAVRLQTLQEVALVRPPPLVVPPPVATRTRPLATVIIPRNLDNPVVVTATITVSPSTSPVSRTSTESAPPPYLPTSKQGWGVGERVGRAV